MRVSTDCCVTLDRADPPENHQGSELDDEESEGHDIIGDPKTARHGRQMDEPPMTARGYPGGGPDARRRGDDHDDDDLLHPERL